MPRKARLDAPGTLHHVIIRGIERRPIVDDDKDRENFVSRLGDLAAETENGIFVWLGVGPRQPIDFTKQVMNFKAFFSPQWNPLRSWLRQLHRVNLNVRF